MTTLGIVLLLLGTASVVAEAHVPGGIFGGVGGLLLVAGAIIVVTGLGGAAVLAVPIGAGAGVAAGAWTLLAVRKGAEARRQRIQAGAEALEGRIGVVRRWTEPMGQVFVDGALWRARRDWSEAEDGTLGVGDRVVVERVTGLTLCVRRAEEWELLT